MDGDAQIWREREEKLSTRQVNAVGDVWAAGGLDTACRLAEKVSHPFVVGVTLGRSLIATSVEDELLTQTLASAALAHRELASGYLRGREIQSGSAWLDGLRSRDAWNQWSAAQRADYFLVLPFEPSTWGAVSASGEDVARAYWTQAGTFGRGDVPASDRDFATGEFLRHGRFVHAVRLLALYVGKQPGPSAELIFNVLKGLSGAKEVSTAELHSAAHDIGGLLDALVQAPSPDEARIAKFEWLFFPLLEHVRPARALHQALATEPSLFVELICLTYKPHAGKPTDPSGEEQQLRARLAAAVLHEWQRPPGLASDGAVSAEALAEWTMRARSLAADADRAIVADLHIGGVLTHVPHGTDGAWPHEAVRDLIERIASDHLESGFRTGVYNNRGVVTREIGEGGRQERGLVASYRENAIALIDTWPRTARLLRRIAEMYGAEAQREDLQAEIEEELLR